VDGSNTHDKSKMADGRHFEKIEKTPYLINSLTDRNEIWYGDARLIDPLDRADRQNFEILKIQDGGSRHSEK